MSSMCLYEAKDPDTTSPDYIRITKLIEQLKLRGILINRAKWDTNPNVSRLVSQNGEKILPAVVVNDFIMITGRYPTNDEIRQILHVPDKLIAEECQGCGCCCIQGYECDE